MIVSRHITSAYYVHVCERLSACSCERSRFVLGLLAFTCSAIYSDTKCHSRWWNSSTMSWRSVQSIANAYASSSRHMDSQIVCWRSADSNAARMPETRLMDLSSSFSCWPALAVQVHTVQTSVIEFLQRSVLNSWAILFYFILFLQWIGFNWTKPNVWKCHAFSGCLMPALFIWEKYSK